MPLYDYTCGKCAKKFEIMRGIRESGPVKCPDCGAECKKNVSATSFQLKGNGWYKTDYSKKDKAHGAGCGCCSSKEACER